MLRRPYLARTGVFALLRLLPKSCTDKDIEILVLRHQLAILQRHLNKPRLTPPDRAFLAALLHHIPRPTLRKLHLIVSPDTVLILRLARENPSRGYRRTHGELATLAIKVAPSTV